MTNWYDITGRTLGDKTPYYLLIINAADAARLRQTVCSIDWPKYRDIETNYVVFRYPIPVSVIAFTDPTSWREGIRSLFGDAIADRIEACASENTGHVHTSLYIDKFSEEDRAKFKSILEEYSTRNDCLFYLHRMGVIGVVYPEEPYYAFLPVYPVSVPDLYGG